MEGFCRKLSNSEVKWIERAGQKFIHSFYILYAAFLSASLLIDKPESFQRKQASAAP